MPTVSYSQPSSLGENAVAEGSSLARGFQLASTTGRVHIWGCLLQRPSPRYPAAAKTVVMAELGRRAWPAESEDTSLRGSVR